MVSSSMKTGGLLNKKSLPWRIGLVTLLVWFLMITMGVVLATSETTTQNPSEQRSDCPMERPSHAPFEIENGPPPPTTPHLVLSINAANGQINWERINNIHSSNDWNVQELVLDGFGTIMNEESFTSAVEHFYPLLETAIQTLQPDILLVSSKGIGLLAYLAAKDLWVHRPAILLSPIPNPIDGLVDGSSSYQSDWNDTLRILQDKLGEEQPVIVAVGSSSDEEMLITECMEATICGKLKATTAKSIDTFQNCTNWYHVVIPNGDHGWKNSQENEKIIAKLIEFSIIKHH